jgi:hypothetical protein
VCPWPLPVIDLFAAADIVLEATLGDTLSREAPGFAPAGQDAA